MAIENDEKMEMREKRIQTFLGQFQKSIDWSKYVGHARKKTNFAANFGKSFANQTPTLINHYFAWLNTHQQNKKWECQFLHF